MSGIFVGIDGSTHSQTALDWAMREAGIRHAPLTVITVHEVAASGWGGSLEFPADEIMREEEKKAVQETVDKAAAQLGDAAPTEITVQALMGSRLRCSSRRPRPPTFSSLVPGAAGASPGSCWARSVPRWLSTRSAPSPSSGTITARSGGHF